MRPTPWRMYNVYKQLRAHAHEQSKQISAFGCRVTPWRRPRERRRPLADLGARCRGYASAQSVARVPSTFSGCSAHNLPGQPMKARANLGMAPIHGEVSNRLTSPAPPPPPPSPLLLGPPFALLKIQGSNSMEYTTLKNKHISDMDSCNPPAPLWGHQAVGLGLLIPAPVAVSSFQCDSSTFYFLLLIVIERARGGAPNQQF